jgi:hypothetical protein
MRRISKPLGIFLNILFLTGKCRFSKYWTANLMKGIKRQEVWVRDWCEVSPHWPWLWSHGVVYRGCWEKGLKRGGWTVSVGVEAEIKITDSASRPSQPYATSVYRYRAVRLVKRAIFKRHCWGWGVDRCNYCPVTDRLRNDTRHASVSNCHISLHQWLKDII